MMYVIHFLNTGVQVTPVYGLIMRKPLPFV
jgi:hypothetical protein